MGEHALGNTPTRVSASVETAAPSAAWAIGLLVAAVLTTAAVRARLLEVPLDRDEGEYAYFGQLLLQGVPPYAGAYNLKMPGTYGAYALILAALGQTTAAIHTGLILVTSATTALIYLLARHLAGPAVSAVAAAIFAVAALDPKLLGTAAYAEHFVLLAAAAGGLVLLRGVCDARPLLVFAGGLLFGLAFLMKQSGGVFVAGSAIFVLVSNASGMPRWSRRLGATALFLVGALTPLVLVCLALWRAGTFNTFWFWTVVYASNYSTDLHTGWVNLVSAMARITPSLLVALALGALGLVVVVRGPRTAGRNLILLLLASGALGTSAGLHFRPQYFLLMLPALAVLAAIGVAALGRLLAATGASALRRAVPVVLVAAALAQPLYASWDVLFSLGPDQVSRAIYGLNPFPESVEVARYIRGRGASDDRIAVIGSEPQIYFYAGRRSATGYIYTYALMEPQPYALAMQQQMIQEVEAANPRYLIFVRVSTSWLIRPGSDATIFGWFGQYQRSFTRVGVVDIMPKETVYRWGAEALGYSPRSEVWLMVFERALHP